VSRILVVDDNADNRYAMRLLLDGFDVVEAPDGDEALRLLAAEHIDLILLDVQMPGIDGFEVCRRVRAREELRSVPIILVTAHARDTESVVRGLAAGGDDYVTKPVAQQELIARVRAMLRIGELQDRLASLNLQLEEQVRRRTEELRQIYATVPVGIYTLDARGRFTSINRRMAEMLGYEKEELVDRESVALLFGEDYDALYWLDLCRREGHTAYETQARRKDGTSVEVYDERVVMLDHLGEYVGFTGYLQDMSQRRRVRAILKEQETQAAVGRLAAGIVHEIVNPISGVQQYLDAMLKRLDQGETIPPSEVRRGASVMRDALQRTSDLIGNLRGFTRSAVRPVQALDPRALIDDLRSLMRHNLHQHGIEFEVVGEPGAATVKGDSGRLAQVFLNLIANAREAMTDGGRLTVEVRADNSTVEVRFSDTGVGIAPEDRERIFEFLYTTKGDKGTGYGLSISRDIVAEHGGRIEVESEPGRGSTFAVVLPRAPG